MGIAGGPQGFFSFHSVVNRPVDVRGWGVSGAVFSSVQPLHVFRHDTLRSVPIVRRGLRLLSRIRYLRGCRRWLNQLQEALFRNPKVKVEAAPRVALNFQTDHAFG